MAPWTKIQIKDPKGENMLDCYDEEGVLRLQEILGDAGKKIVENFHATSPDFAKLIVNFGYGELYTRQTLSDKEKELAAVSSLVSQGKTGLPLKAHIQGMLNVGWKMNDVIELFIFLTGYVGLPTTVEAFKTLQEIQSANEDK
ncbi:MAG: carboxymuconolactone decarboxylase family protein [Chlamydiales bacterium]|nr:carboxymuconolactone decarboxylase family protein [Chlamydiales bacterium]